MWHPSLKLDKTFTQNLASGALSYTSDFGRRFRLESVTIKSSVPITEIITITIDSVYGVNYDVVLESKELNAESSYVFIPSGDLLLNDGDEIKVQCTQANATGTVYGVLRASELLK